MKKICFLSGDMSRSGGTERVLAIIANELCKKEDLFEIHILNITNDSMESFFCLDKRIKMGRVLKKIFSERFLPLPIEFTALVIVFEASLFIVLSAIFFKESKIPITFTPFHIVLS